MRSSRGARRRPILVTLLLAVFALAMPATASADEAESMYTTNAVVAINLTLSQTSREELEAEPEEYVPATFSLATTNGTPSGIGTFTPAIEVGLRLKGSSSFEGLDGKAAFKVKFDKFVADQKFLGLEKMTLNNMVQDPSMQHEALAYQGFRDAGVPAPRTGYAFVRVNGQAFGLYLNIESLDVIALERIFGAPFQNPPQHLYEASYGFDVYPGEAEKFEVDEGESKTRTDLEALITAVNASTPSSFSERVAAKADLAEMTRMWAIEKYIGHWDGYAGSQLEEGPTLSRPNNYYLYSDPAGKFQMIPWGTDQAFDRTIGFDEKDGLMFDLCLEDAVCLGMFRAAVRNRLAPFKSGGYEQLASKLAARLEPWQELDPRKPYDQEDIAEAVEWIDYFVGKRVEDAEEWLGPEPPPVLPPVLPVPTPPTGDQPPSLLPAPVAPPRGPLLRVSRTKVAGHSLRTHLDLAAAGVVTQVGTTSSRGRTVTVCRETTEVDRGRSLKLHCKLNDKARDRLREHRLKITLTTRFDPADGAPESTTLRLTIPAEKPPHAR